MFELIKLTKNTYYIESPAKIGLIKLNENEVCLIDSGNDKDAGRKIRQILDANNWTLKTIYHTHSNADHIGGNNYLQKQTNCDIFAYGIECEFTKNPILEPSFLYGGYPPSDLRHKFLMAQSSDANYLTKENITKDLEIIPLHGHFFDMVGFRTKDDVIFLGDCLSSLETLDKYQLTFIYNVEEYLKTLEMVKTLEAKLFVPSHASVTDNIKDLVQCNIDKVYEISNTIIEICQTPQCFEQILQKIFNQYNLVMNFEQHVLVGSSLKSYLSWLKDNNRLHVQFVDNMLLWSSVE